MLSHILKSEKKIERDVDPRETAIAVPDLAEALGGDMTMLRGEKGRNGGLQIGYSPVLTPVNSESFEGSQISHDHKSLS